MVKSILKTVWKVGKYSIGAAAGAAAVGVISHFCESGDKPIEVTGKVVGEYDGPTEFRDEE